jgi:hypothetical protein
LLLYHFSFSFHRQWHRNDSPLYNDLQERTQGNSLPLTIFVLPWLTFAFSINAFLMHSLFHCRFCRQWISKSIIPWLALFGHCHWLFCHRWPALPALFRSSLH